MEENSGLDARSVTIECGYLWSFHRIEDNQLFHYFSRRLTCQRYVRSNNSIRCPVVLKSLRGCKFGMEDLTRISLNLSLSVECL